MQIDTIDLDNRVVTLRDGRAFPITDMFDEDGEDCEAEDAVVIVTGEDGFGWMTIEITGFEPMAVH